VLLTIPRDDPRNPVTGVFSTRSPDRPNPIGLHRVRVIAVDGLRVQVDHLEVLDGTPVIDVKAALGEIADR
jgi:tRNA (Thr-GGU) A37 N-methylase